MYVIGSRNTPFSSIYKSCPSQNRVQNDSIGLSTSAIRDIMDYLLCSLLMLCIVSWSVASANVEVSDRTNRNFAMADPINNLGFLMSTAINETGNFFYSPLGMSMSLGMAYLGAGGETAQQMRQSLHYDTYNVNFEQVHESIKDICRDVVPVVTDDADYTFDVANALFSQKGLDIEENFLNGLRSQYHADTETMDFTSKSESEKVVNSWIRNKTSGFIDSFQSDSSSLSSTAYLLINAVHFKGNWKTSFPVNMTFDTHFYVGGEDRETYVPTMSLFRIMLPYLKDDETGYKFLELPYKGDRIVMLFALPLRHDQPADLRMTPELWKRIQQNLTDTDLQVVSIPKFKLEYQKNLKAPLKSMGLSSAFEPSAADFSGMSPDQIYLSDVLHKAVVEVNEEGSEAATATGLFFVPISARQVDDFRANHPFLFYIYDKKTGTILFSGKLTDPRN